MVCDWSLEVQLKEWAGLLHSVAYYWSLEVQFKLWTLVHLEVWTLEHSVVDDWCLHRVRVMVLNTTFNNISVILQRSVLLVKET